VPEKKRNISFERREIKNIFKREKIKIREAIQI
jgi:hypothetical protein